MGLIVYGIIKTHFLKIPSLSSGANINCNDSINGSFLPSTSFQTKFYHIILLVRIRFLKFDSIRKSLRDNHWLSSYIVSFSFLVGRLLSIILLILKEFFEKFDNFGHYPKNDFGDLNNQRPYLLHKVLCKCEPPTNYGEREDRAPP